jgi:hypothetical protein
MKAMLTRSKFLAAKGIQAAIIASPIFFAVAPSQAATLTKTFNGFTEAFAPGEFITTTNGSGTATFTPTTLTLVRQRTSGSTPVVNYQVSKDLMETFRPLGVGAVKFLSGVYSYDWEINSNTTNNGGLSAYNFSQAEVGQTTRKLAFPATPAQTPANIANGTGQNIATELVDGSTFGWFLRKTNNTGSPTNSNATATISNFVFTATYETVPGPLPLVGAAAAFAWSRRLRRRLKTAQTSI